MQKNLKYKYELFLAIILVAFVAFKWESLFLPYFWDELAYYSKALLYLSDNGLSLLPHGLPPDLSRGHPLFFQFIGGFWIKCFGNSLFSVHAFALILSLITIIALYKIIELVADKKSAILGVALIIVQPLFFTQSALILPEMLVALLTIFSIYFFLKEKYIIYLLFSSLLVLTKETSVIVVFAIFSYSYYKTKSIRAAIKYLAPCLILILFFFIQKIQNGWFLFPFHVEIIAIKSGLFFENILKSIYFIFVAQGKFILTLFIGIQTFFLFNKKLNTVEKEITILSLFIIITSIFLISALYLMNRYYLFVLPFTILLGVLGFKNSINTYKFVRFLTPLLFAPVLFMHTKNTFNIDANLDYINTIKATEKTYNYLISNNFESKRGYCHFSILRAFGDYRLGYNHQKMEFNLQEEKSTTVDFAIEINPERWNKNFSYWNDFKLVKKIKEGNFEILIFEK